MTGAELRLLSGKTQIVGSDRRQYLIAAVTVDDADSSRIQAARSINHMLQQRLSGHRVKYFRQGRLHAFAHTGSENNDVHK